MKGKGGSSQTMRAAACELLQAVEAAGRGTGRGVQRGGEGVAMPRREREGGGPRPLCLRAVIRAGSRRPLVRDRRTPF